MIFNILLVILAILFPIARTQQNRLIFSRQRSNFCIINNDSANPYATYCSDSPQWRMYFDAGRLRDQNWYYCMYESSGAGSAGSVVYFTPCQTANHFIWTWDEDDRLVVGSSKAGAPMCLEVNGGAIGDWTRLVINPCSKTSVAQRFYRNFVCLAGQTLNTAGDACVACNGGTYKSKEGYNACKVCPANADCPTVTGFTCRAGFTMNPTDDGCVACSAGTFKTVSGNQACTTCPSGASCPSTVASFTCLAGFGLTADSTGCQLCSGATPYKPSGGNQACSACPSSATCPSFLTFTCTAGNQLNTAKTGCEACGASSYKAIDGNQACTACPTSASCSATTFNCDAGHTLNPAGNGCVQCSFGTAKSAPGNGACTACAIGQESSADRKQCVPCQANFYRPHLLVDQCISCPANADCTTSQFTCKAGYTLSGNLCVPCDEGYMKAAFGNISCTRCSSLGTETNPTRTACQPCAANFYQPSSVSTKCIACPTGATCTTTSFSCGVGWRNNDKGDGCVQCPLGREVSADKTNCDVCQSGWYRSALTMPSCAKCPDFADCTTTSFTCKDGFIKNADQTGCVLKYCLDGYYLPSVTSTSCRKCPANANCLANGFSCLRGYSFSQATNDCVPCADGLFKGFEGNFQCDPCTVPGQEPSIDKTYCLQCAIGKFKPVDSTLKTCINCPSNSVCTSTDFSCNPGYTRDGSNYACVKCASGYMKSGSGNSACIACPSGYFSNDNYTSCLQCDSGFFRAPSGICLKCPAGQESNDLRTECSDCKPGFYRPDTKNPTCQICPVGAICTSTSFSCENGFLLNSDKTGCLAKPAEMQQTDNTAGVAAGSVFGVLGVLGVAIYGYLKVYPAYSQGQQTANSSSYELNSSSNHLTQPRQGLTLHGSGSNSSLGNLTAATGLRSMGRESNFSKNTMSKPGAGTLNKSPLGSTNEFSAAPPLPTYSWNRGGATINRQMSMMTADTDVATTRDVATIGDISGTEMGISIPSHLQYHMGTDFRSQKFASQDESYNVFLGSATNAELLQFGEPIVIRELQRQNDQDEVDRLYQEVCILYQMRECPNIVKMGGYSVSPYSMVMKYYQLGSLETWISSRKFIKRKAIIVGFINCIADGLEYLHKRGYAHLSLRPGNIMLDIDANESLICVLSGLSNSQSVNDTAQKQQKTVALNYSTRAYLSPEMIKQYRSQNRNVRIDLQKVDMFAFGIIAYQLTSRTLPWSKN